MPDSSVWSSEDFLAVNIEPFAPCLNTSHQLLGVIPLLIRIEHSIDKFGTTLSSHLDALLTALCPVPHKLLACTKECLELLPKPFTVVEKIADNLLVFIPGDKPVKLTCSFEFTTKKDQKLPQLTSHICCCVKATMVEFCPIEDPLAKRIGVEDTPKKDDRAFFGVPVLETVVRGNTVLGCFGTMLLRINYWRIRSRGLGSSRSRARG